MSEDICASMQDFELNPENYTLSGGHWKTSVEINHLFSLIKERNYALVGFFQRFTEILLVLRD